MISPIFRCGTDTMPPAGALASAPAGYVLFALESQLAVKIVVLGVHSG